MQEVWHTEKYWTKLYETSAPPIMIGKDLDNVATEAWGRGKEWDGRDGLISHLHFAVLCPRG